MDSELIKSIIMVFIGWVLIYGINCSLALPDGRHNESDYVPLPKPIAYILFLPLAIGKCRSYMILAIFLQVALFLFLPVYAFAEYLVHIGAIAEERVETYMLVFFSVLIGAGLLAHLIRWLIKRPKRYYPRSRRRSALRRRIRRRKRR